MKSKRIVVIILLIFFFAVTSILIWSFFRFGFFSPPSKVWHGYYTVVFKENENVEILVNRLKREKCLGGVISIYTSPVMFYDFSGFKWVTIESIDRFLDREDPRYDDYLVNAKNFFVGFYKGENYKMFYVPLTERPFFTYIRLVKLFSGTNIVWHLVDYSPLITVFSIVFFLGFSFFIVLGWDTSSEISVFNRFFTLAGIVPWILVMFNGDVIVAGFAFLFFPLYVSLVFRVYSVMEGYSSYKDSKGERVRDVVFFFMVLLFFFLFVIVRGFEIGSILTVLWVLLFDTALIGFMVTIVKVQAFFYSHSIFKPVRILGDLFLPRRNGVRGGKFFLLAVGSFVVFVVTVFAVERAFNTLIIPQPRRFYTGRRLSEWEQFESLRKTEGGTRIPNLSDYIAHRAYQETLKFKYDTHEAQRADDWFPRENSVIYLKEFYYDRYKNKIFGRKIIVKHFDETWLKSILLKIKSNSLEKIIENQGEITRVNYFPVRELPYWRLYPLEFIVLTVGLLYYLFFFNWRFSAKVSYDFGRLYEE